MTHALKTTAYAVLVAAAAVAPLFAGTAAEAGRGKEHFVQEYFFAQPMNGKEGFEGAYYCSYMKQKVMVTTPTGEKKEVWKLTQVCQ